MLVYTNNGLQFKRELPGYVLQAGEASFPDDPPPTTQQLQAAFPGYAQAVTEQNAPTQLETMLGNGITITSTSTAALNSTYALDPTTLDQIRAVALDSAAGLGLPGGGTTFTYPDKASVPRTFSGAQIQALYKAMRDLVFVLNTQEAIQAAGGSPSWPAQTATIP